MNDKVSLQGNLDPLALFSPPEIIRTLVDEMVQSFGTHKYIANLGHGCLPSHNPEHIGAFIDAVHTSSKRLILDQGKN